MLSSERSTPLSKRYWQCHIGGGEEKITRDNGIKIQVNKKIFNALLTIGGQEVRFWPEFQETDCQIPLYALKYQRVMLYYESDCPVIINADCDMISDDDFSKTEFGVRILPDQPGWTFINGLCAPRWRYHNLGSEYPEGERYCNLKGYQKILQKTISA